MNWDGRQSVFDALGNHMSDKEAAENIEHVWTIIEKAMKLSNDDSASIPVDKSLYDYFEEQIADMFPSDKGDDARKKQQTILNMAEMWGAFVGSPIQTQSLKFFWLEECIDGENLFVASTYEKVLKKIAEPALLNATVLFEHKVKRIISEGENEAPKVTVEIEGKESMEFDEVAMTAPLGWLKKNLGVFVPELPNRFKEAVTNLGYGHLDKVSHTPPQSNLANIVRYTSPSQRLSGMKLRHPPTHIHQPHPVTKVYQTSQQQQRPSTNPQTHL
jgi:hypothetical protein